MSSNTASQIPEKSGCATAAARSSQPEPQRPQDPEFSVCVETAAGWIYVAEFRTLQEATQLAEGAVERSQLRTQIRRCGDVVHELQPCFS